MSNFRFWVTETERCTDCQGPNEQMIHADSKLTTPDTRKRLPQISRDSSKTVSKALKLDRNSVASRETKPMLQCLERSITTFQNWLWLNTSKPQWPVVNSFIVLCLTSIDSVRIFKINKRNSADGNHLYFKSSVISETKESHNAETVEQTISIVVKRRLKLRGIFAYFPFQNKSHDIFVEADGAIENVGMHLINDCIVWARNLTCALR